MHFRAKAAALRGAETMQHLGEICMAQRSRGKCGRNVYCVKARRDFQTAGLNGVFGYFCRRGQKYPAPAGAECPFGQSAARVFRACGRGGRMWASAPTHGYRWSFRRGRCPHRPVCRGAAAAYLSLRQRFALPPQLRFAAQPSVHPKGTCFAASTGPPRRGRQGTGNGFPRQ